MILNEVEDTEERPKLKPELMNTDETLRLFVDYEVRSSWWASFIGWTWLQNIAAWYFAAKTHRKWKRWLASTEAAKRLKL